jgi:hypothetical protein
MPSTDTKPELTAKASMAQPVSQPAVYANVLTGWPFQVDVRAVFCVRYEMNLKVQIKFCFLNVLSLEKSVKITRGMFIPEISECTYCVNTSSLIVFSFIQT